MIKILNNVSHCLLFILLLSLLSGCTKTEKPTPDTSIDSPTPTITMPVEELPKVIDIQLTKDNPYEDLFLEDPYSQISVYMLETWNPDRELYNDLFQRVINHDPVADLSGYNLTNEQIMDTCSALYEQAGFQLYYLNYAKWSSDYKTAIFTYNEDTIDTITQNRDRFFAQMNHLLYNVAPNHYTPHQKFFALYDYITKHADYSDNVSDMTTLTAYSILMNQKGICGGFAILADYVLNYNGIQSQYISNEAHAWNIIELDGVRYHTDFTWGSGNPFSNSSLLYTILMDDKQRIEGLKALNFDSTIIEGYPRDNPTFPAPCSDTRYQLLYDIYYDYSLDIENNLIYYSDYEGIHHMNLDSTGLTTIYDSSVSNLQYFEGALYFSQGPNDALYKLVPGQSPILIDDSFHVYYTRIQDGILSYSSGDYSENQKTINLNSFTTIDLSNSDRTHLSTQTMSKSETFEAEIKFSEKMDTSQLPRTFVGLVTSQDQVIPLTMHWGDNKTLYVRSASLLSAEDSVTLYVTPGITAANGQVLKEGYDITIEYIQ